MLTNVLDYMGATGAAWQGLVESVHNAYWAWSAGLFDAFRALVGA